MLWRREGTEKIEEKESILSGMVATGFVTNILLQTEETFFFNVPLRMGTFTNAYEESIGLHFGNSVKLEFVLKDA